MMTVLGARWHGPRYGVGSAMSSRVAIGRRSRAWSYVLAGAGVLAACLTPVLATGAWLVLTDAGLATEVATTGDWMPLVRAIADTLGEALRDLLTYL